MTPAIPPRPFPVDFVRHLRGLATHRPHDTAVIAVCDEGGELVEETIDYLRLDQRVRALAARLQRDLAPGDRVLIALENGDDYVVSFFACFYAGLIAVPVFPPESRRAHHVGRLQAIAGDAGVRMILTHRSLVPLLDAVASVVPGARVVAVDTHDDTDADAWTEPAASPFEIAFLQYTSGSTSSPKGVMVTHASLMANMRALAEGFGVTASDVFVTWLPLNHDMGLIGGLLQPIHAGIPVVLMSPRYFMERPLRWLEAIARHRGTISGGPDFAFRLCNDRITPQQVARLDLSSWAVAFSGAEPVRPDTLEAFIALCEPGGFSPGAAYPCYGLAEATLFLTGGRRGEGLAATRFSGRDLAARAVSADASGVALAGCGRTATDHAVRIVDPDTLSPMPAGRVGEIWASGPSITRGYWNKLQATLDTFVERDGGTWLRTGDLGFEHGGHLHIAGRLKDMIIVRGHNLYPQDIERAVEDSVDAVRKGRVAAFCVDGPGSERIGLAAEVSRSMQKLVPPERLVEALSEAVGEFCGEPLAVVVLLHPGGLPKTSSGKLQRRASRAGWLDGTLDAYAVLADGRLVVGAPSPAAPSVASPPTPAAGFATSLAALWHEVLKLDPAVTLRADAHFFGSGGSSLAAAELCARIESRWGVVIGSGAVFEHPRLDDLARHVAERRQAAPRPVETPVAEAGAPAVMSHAQERQWFLWRLDPSATAHHVSGRLDLSGDLDTARLRDAFSRVVARHAPLRTVFREGADGTAEPVVLPDLSVAMDEEDLRAADGVADEARVVDTLRRLNGRPFDLASGPLLRVACLRVGRDAQVLVIVMHHIVSDGASMQVLLDDLAARLRDGGAAPSPLPLSYAAHAARERARLAGGEGARQLAWWRATLGDDHPVLELPADHPRPPQAQYTAGCLTVDVPDELVQDLRRLAAAEGATLFMVLLAGYQALLHRYTGQRDVRVGAPMANRPHDTRGLVGLFVNTVVLRAVVHGRMPLAEVLARAKSAALGAQANQDLPFEQLVEALRPERSLSHNPLVQVTLNHIAEDFRAFESALGVSLTGHEVLRETVQFDLTLETHETPDGRLRASFVHAKELFEPATIRALAAHYLALLRAFVEQPGQALADVPLLDDAERARQAAWGSGPAADAEPRWVHQFVEAQARERPDAVAVLHGDQSLGYGELNRRANRLAHRLIALGVGPEARVGIAVERSVDMLVCLLATMKAGGAYVPLDPAYPPERLDHMVRDSGIVLVLCQGAVRDRLPSVPGLPMIDVDAGLVVDVRSEAASCDVDPDVALHGENLAYVIYTSGSTGLPKGVAVAHGPLASHLRAIGEVYAVTPSHRELFFFSLSFDAAVEQWMTPLRGGGAVVLCDREELAGERFVELVVRQGVTTLHVPPAYLRVVAPLLAAVPSRVRTCIVGGEAFPWADYTLARAAFRAPRIVNAYGPTETLITPTAWVGGELPAADSGSVPIGTPVGSRRVHVLDDDLNLVPRGVIGELYVGGHEIARGYTGRPALTSDRFVADPFGPEGGRLYRTGDRVRWHPDGHLEYFGRRDQQVKVRGFRIELGEIEARLLALPGVREAVVGVLGDGGGERLVAHVGPRPGVGLDAEALRTALKAQLPDYMVPHAIVLLPALPLTPNGKVDRAALPAPAFGVPSHTVAPAGDLESAIAAIWAEALGVPRVGRHDNFFDLGGHSLLLIKVHSRLVERLGLTVSMVDLFQHTTVSALAARAAGGGPRPAAGDVQARAQRQRSHFLKRPTTAERATP